MVINSWFRHLYNYHTNERLTNPVQIEAKESWLKMTYRLKKTSPGQRCKCQYTKCSCQRHVPALVWKVTLADCAGRAWEPPRWPLSSSLFFKAVRTRGGGAVVVDVDLASGLSPASGRWLSVIEEAGWLPPLEAWSAGEEEEEAGFVGSIALLLP